MSFPSSTGGKQQWNEGTIHHEGRASATATASATASGAGGAPLPVPLAPYPPITASSQPPASAAMTTVPFTPASHNSNQHHHYQHYQQQQQQQQNSTISSGASVATASTSQPSIFSSSRASMSNVSGGTVTTSSTKQQQQQQQQTMKAKQQPQQQHPAQVQFHPFHANLYGAVNCLPHNNYHRDDGYCDDDDDGSQRLDSRRPSVSGNGRTSAGSGLMRVKKLGPVLLELRLLELISDDTKEQDDDNYNHDNHNENGDIDLDENRNTNLSPFSSLRHHGMAYTGRTIAKTRGISASSVASTCLSFRNNPHAQGTNSTINATSNIASSANATSTAQSEAHAAAAAATGATTKTTATGGGVIQCATGLTSGALCIHTLRNLDRYMSPPSDDRNDMVANYDPNTTKRRRRYEVLDSAHSDDATVSHYSHYQPRHHRPASAVAWRNSSGTHGVGDSHVAIGLVGSNWTSSSFSTLSNASVVASNVGGIPVGSGGGIRAGSAGLVKGSGGNAAISTGAYSNAGITNSSMDGGRGGMSGGRVGSSAFTTRLRGDYAIGSAAAGSMVGGGMVGSIGGGGGSDREYCCMIWDVEVQGSISKGVKQTPLHRLAHGSGVASLSWMSNGQLLAIGCQYRNIQLYDLRVSGTNAPPTSLHAHSASVNGIVVDPYRPHVFATFSRELYEPVKLWDIKKMDDCFAEIKITNHVSGSGSGGGDDDNYGGSGKNGDMREDEPAMVTNVAWEPSSPGTLCVGMGETLRYFDCRSNPLRPFLTRMTHASSPLQCLEFQPRRPPVVKATGNGSNNSSGDGVTGSNGGYGTGTAASAEGQEKKQLLATKVSEREFYPQRMLAVQIDGVVRDMPLHQISPLAVSRRDGRITHSLGGIVWVGDSTFGPSAMENQTYTSNEDISSIMMRRARCLHLARYSTDASSNLHLLSEEKNIRTSKEKNQNIHDETAYISSTSNEALLSLWNWIKRVENLCSNEGVSIDDFAKWPARGLIDSGVLKLLHMSLGDKDDLGVFENVSVSQSLHCKIYESPMRCAALTACGWPGKLSLRDVLAECEALGNFERSAALAVWHGDLGQAVVTLQRGADYIRFLLSDDTKIENNRPLHLSTPQYAETLELVAMCVAGYTGNCLGVWKRACEGLMQRKDLCLTGIAGSRAYAPYLRAICVFLNNIGQTDGFDKTLYDENLCLSDRVSFASIFLHKADLKTYLENCIEECLRTGNLEGILVTGLEKRGISLLQSYVDTTSDVQTAALVSSRVILPVDWVKERTVCSEWLDSYREMLNTWQMWQSRAMFDVGRAELLRKLRDKQAEELVGGTIPQGVRGSMQFSGRRGLGQSQSRRQSNFSIGNHLYNKQGDAEIPLPIFPAQLNVRCNYCNTSLPLSKLRRQEGVANSWLSRQKPVLSTCPNTQCRKPLPRCAICLLPLGCLNPYTELRRERNRLSRGSNGLQNMDDLSELANLPFAEWFTWCLRCKHGGHAHHLVGWFANHETCPVSGCDCLCQFDGIQKLARPALAKKDGQSD